VVYLEAGVVLDLLDSLARRLTSLDVTSQKRLMETKYSLLSSKVNARHKKQLAELAFQALETGLYFTNHGSTNSSQWCPPPDKF